MRPNAPFVKQMVVVDPVANWRQDRTCKPAPFSAIKSGY